MRYIKSFEAKLAVNMIELWCKNIASYNLWLYLALFREFASVNPIYNLWFQHF